MFTVYHTPAVCEQHVALRIRESIRQAYSAPIVHEDRFTARCERILKRVRHRWYYSSQHMEDILQEVRLALWQQYRAEPAAMDTADDTLWYRSARRAASVAYYHLQHKGRYTRTTIEGKRVRHKVVFNADDLNHLDDVDTDEFIEEHAGRYDSTHDTEEFRHADARLEVERLLKTGLTQLGPKRRAQVLTLIQGIMDGLSLIDIARGQGWSEWLVHEIRRVMRQALYMAATGETYAATDQSKDERLDEIQHAKQLRAEGLSLAQIAHRLGRSKAWVQQALSPTQVNPALKASALMLKAQGLTWAQVGQNLNLSASYAKHMCYA